MKAEGSIAASVLAACLFVTAGTEVQSARQLGTIARQENPVPVLVSNKIWNA